ncbi:MAG: hypothetical protein JNL28_00945 [Planctomycetes bacterium]|nr:hypothetical protein [Planctomycetota bacterium]
MRSLTFTLPALLLLAGGAEAQQFETRARGNVRTGHETFPPNVNLPAAPVGGSDACSTAEALGSAVGSVAYNLVGATTGTEGQTTFTGGYCNYGCAEYGTGQVAVLNDVWFSWSSPATGRVRITSCPNQNDTKIAVYAGTTCPTGVACVGCNDDYHFVGGVTAGLLDSTVYFNATLGEMFLIQVGKSSLAGATPNFAGSIDIAVNPPHATTGILDDNLSETDIGAGAAGAGNLGLNRFGNVGDVTTLSGLSVCWGGPGSGHVNGTPAVIGLWTDPNNDGNPTDAVLVPGTNVATTVQSANTDTFVTIPFPSHVTVNDIYYVGYSYQRISTANFPLTLDNTVCNIQPDTAWTVINTGAPVNLANLAANTVPPTRLESNCQAQGAFNGIWHSAFSVRADIVLGTPTSSTCLGDGTQAACPCGNTGAAGNGCGSSAFPGGALLTASGVAGASAGTDSWVLTANNIPGPGLFFQATALAPNAIQFGDGHLCAAVNIVRLGVVFPIAGVASYPGGLTPNPIHIAGGTSSGDLRHYQCWYRSVPGLCGAANFDLTQVLTVTWGP